MEVLSFLSTLVFERNELKNFNLKFCTEKFLQNWKFFTNPPKKSYKKVANLLAVYCKIFHHGKEQSFFFLSL